MKSLDKISTSHQLRGNMGRIAQERYNFIAEYSVGTLQTVEEPDPHNHDPALRLSFLLVGKNTGTMQMEEMTAVPANEESRRNWLREVAAVRTRARSNKLFGVEISVLLARQNNPSHVFDIPTFLLQWFSFIMEQGMMSEGIFRVSGNNTQMQAARRDMDLGKEVNIGKLSVHGVAGLLKLWLRELPAPLIPVELYDDFANAKSTSEVASLVKRVGRPDVFVLQHLFYFLSRVAEYKG
tara:strand:- start:458 stop:1171 length:714 start_codon:yes stop_codon:yes gene_type:complete